MTLLRRPLTQPIIQRKPPYSPTVPSVSKSSRSSLASTRGRLILLLGVSGIGKTSLVTHFPKTYWIIDPYETGVLDLVDSGMINISADMVHEPFDNFNSILSFNTEILQGRIPFPQEVNTLVYESMTGMEKFCHETCCVQSFNGNWEDRKGGFMFYQKGYEVAAAMYWTKFIKQLSSLREVGYNVILTGHSEVKMQKNVVGDDYICETSNCRPETFKQTHSLFENVFFYSLDVLAAKEDGNKHARARAKSFSRMLHVVKTPYHDAKNRCGLFEDIEVEGTPLEAYLALCKACRWNPETLKYI